MGEYKLEHHGNKERLTLPTIIWRNIAVGPGDSVEVFIDPKKGLLIVKAIR